MSQTCIAVLCSYQVTSDLQRVWNNKDFHDPLINAVKDITPIMNAAIKSWKNVLNGQWKHFEASTQLFNGALKQNET